MFNDMNLGPDHTGADVIVTVTPSGESDTFSVSWNGFHLGTATCDFVARRYTAIHDETGMLATAPTLASACAELIIIQTNYA